MKKYSNLLIRISKYILIIFAIFISFIAIIIFILTRPSSSLDEENILKTKEEIVDFYKKNSKSFKSINQKITSMPTVERNITRISAQTDVNQAVDADIAAIKNGLINLNIKSVLIKENGDIDYCISTWGLSMSGRVYGLYHSKKPPKNYYKCQSNNQQIEAFENLQLMQTPPTGCSYTVFAKIDKDWYFYDDYED